MIKPIRTKVLVEPIFENPFSHSGFIVPESFKERGAKAKVIATGDGTKDIRMEVKEGYVLWHVKDAGTELVEDGKQYFLIDSRDILGYLPN